MLILTETAVVTVPGQMPGTQSEKAITTLALVQGMSVLSISMLLSMGKMPQLITLPIRYELTPSQASANCLLRHSLRRLDAEGFKVIGSVHDEIIIECLACDADDVRRRMIEIMTTPPDWARGLPLEVEGDIMERFSK